MKTCFSESFFPLDKCHIQSSRNVLISYKLLREIFTVGVSGVVGQMYQDSLKMDKNNHDVLIFEWFSPSLQNGGGGIGRECRGGNCERPPPSSCFFFCLSSSLQCSLIFPLGLMPSNDSNTKLNILQVRQLEKQDHLSAKLHTGDVKLMKC